ncbi:hypothetical protein Tco_0021251, partial [Tanacetum coccineum]
MPRGTTQRVTRGTSNDWCQVPGTVAVRGGRHVCTRYFSDDGWTNQRMTRGTGVCQSE